MASKTTNYGLNKHSPQDFYNVEARNENWDKIDETLAATDPTKITTKAAPADGDGVMIADSADGGKAKRLLWSSVKTALGKLFVPLARKVNGKALSADVTLTAADIKMPNSEEDVGAAMAKRLWRYTQMWNEDDAPATADAVNQLEPGCYGFVLHKRKDWFPNELKDLLARYELIVHNTADRIQNGTLKLRCIDGSYQLMEYIGEILRETKGTTIRWRRVATCNPPGVHELPLVNGATAEKSCVYYKTQENLVIGKFSLQASAAAYQEIPVAVLPEGFRPPLDFPFIVASCARKGVTWEGTGWGRIAPDGTIFVYQNIAWGWVEAQFSFIAAS